MSNGEGFWDESGMDRQTAFAFEDQSVPLVAIGKQPSVPDPTIDTPESTGDMASKVHPWTAPLPVGNKVGKAPGRDTEDIRNWEMIGRYDSDDSPFSGNISDDCTPGQAWRNGTDYGT